MDKSIVLVHRKPIGLRMDWLATLFLKKPVNLEKIQAYQLAQKRMDAVHAALDDRIRQNALR